MTSREAIAVISSWRSSTDFEPFLRLNRSSIAPTVLSCLLYRWRLVSSAVYCSLSLSVGHEVTCVSIPNLRYTQQGQKVRCVEIGVPRRRATDFRA
jgi:hypothetical protein